MRQHKHTLLSTGFLATFSLLGLLVAAGCNKSEQTPAVPTPGMRMGGPGGMGGRGAMVAANATGAQIYQAKCQGCHGDQGQGVRGPSLKGAGSKPDAKLTATIHDGHGRMPAFGSQLTADQITKVVTYIKTFK